MYALPPPRARPHRDHTSARFRDPHGAGTLQGFSHDQRASAVASREARSSPFPRFFERVVADPAPSRWRATGT